MVRAKTTASPRAGYLGTAASCARESFPLGYGDMKHFKIRARNLGFPVLAIFLSAVLLSLALPGTKAQGETNTAVSPSPAAGPPKGTAPKGAPTLAKKEE